MAKISLLKKEGIIEKISYERRAYESVDDRKTLNYVSYISKINGKQNSGTNGLIYFDAIINILFVLTN